MAALPTASTRRRSTTPRCLLAASRCSRTLAVPSSTASAASRRSCRQWEQWGGRRGRQRRRREQRAAPAPHPALSPEYGREGREGVLPPPFQQIPSRVHFLQPPVAQLPRGRYQLRVVL